MLEISEAFLDSVSVHVIGNKTNQEELKLSTSPLDVREEKLEKLLLRYFLSNFTSPEFFSFTFSNEDFTLNLIYKFAREIFEDRETFHENSVNMARHLYEATQHPNIKSGDLYVAFFSDLALNGGRVEGIGIFKSENKESYLKVEAGSRDISVRADEGTNIRKLDKGCLIFNTDAEAGFRVCVVDTANKTDAQFWSGDFLNVKPWSDAFHHTQNFLNLTRQYLVDEMQDEFKVSKADQIDLLNRSVNFFKKREQFDQREFESEVLADANVIESFRKFGKNYEGDVVDNFEISAQAVKRSARIFKSVLKLDKNFHIYIHGNRELIEKGFDEVMGKHYYKVYFDSES